MALIKCSECGKEVSTQATACPHCGCPIAASPKEAASPSEPQPASKSPEQLDEKWERWGAQQASAPPAPTPGTAPAQPSAGPPQKQKQAGKGLGCLGWLGIIVFCVLIGWIADMAGCNTETPHSDSYQAGFTVGRMEGLMAYRSGKPHASQEDLDASARRTMGGVQFDPAKGGLKDWILGYQVGYDIGWDQAKSGK
ncbi:MAG: hypothetical protein ABSF95_00560 [Verrucomicrobiota bacterium]|jgi:hypothetical protein